MGKLTKIVNEGETKPVEGVLFLPRKKLWLAILTAARETLCIIRTSIARKLRKSSSGSVYCIAVIACSANRMIVSTNSGC